MALFAIDGLSMFNDFAASEYSSRYVVVLTVHFTRPPSFLTWNEKFLLFDINMDIVYEGRDSRSWIRACCYSPDGAMFALASTDHKIYLYDSKSFALKAKVSTSRRMYYNRF